MLASAASSAGQEPGLIYSTFVGTSSWEGAEAITVDDSGRVYVVGATESTTVFPGVGESPAAHEIDLVVFRLNAAGTALDYTIYLNTDPGATEMEDIGFDIAVDNTGSAYVVGQTEKTNFCSFFGNVPGYDTTHNGSVDAFVMKIKPDGNGLDYCTFLGGSEWDTSYSLALDQDNNAFLTGFTWSADFPATAGAYDNTINGLRDTFVAQLSADGTRLEYATYVGGTGQESGTAIALDSQNNAYVTGWTNSDDLPTPTPVIDTIFDGPFDGFVYKLNDDGSDLLFNTYLGGTDEDRGQDILVDGQGNIFVVGDTRAPDFPVTSGAMDTTFGGGICFFTNCADAFAVRLNSAATAFDYATFIGGDSEDLAHAAFLHQDGGLFVTGESISETGFPTTTSGYDPTPNGEGDGYVVFLNSVGSTIHYGSYIGSTDVDQATALWTDAQSTIYLSGLTLSTDFPTIPGSYDTQHNGDYDIFVSKLLLPEIMKSFVPAVLN